MEISPMMDRNNPNIEKSQVFIEQRCEYMCMLLRMIACVRVDVTHTSAHVFLRSGS